MYPSTSAFDNNNVAMHQGKLQNVNSFQEERTKSVKGREVGANADTYQ